MNQQEIFEVIVRHARTVVPALENHQFQYSDSLKDLGANSIDRSEIVMMTLDSLSLRIPLVEIAAVRNIGDLACVIRDKA